MDSLDIAYASCSWSDYDNDGDVDIVISHVDLEAAPVLLRNDSNNGNHWLGITLKGPEGFSTGMGAIISVFSEGKKQVVVQQWSMGYLSNNDPRMHLGLGEANSIEKLEVVWPGGSKQTFENLEADQYITIDKTNGIVSP